MPGKQQSPKQSIMPQTAGGWGIKNIMHKIRNFKLKRTAKRPSYRTSNTSRPPMIKMDQLIQNQEPEIYKQKVKMGNEFDLFDKFARHKTNGGLIPVVLGWLKTHIPDTKSLSDDCGVVPNTMINKALRDDVSTDAQLAAIVNEYISNCAPLNVYKSLTALVISYVVWYQKRGPQMQNTKNNNIAVIENDYNMSVQFLAKQSQKYISACMRVLDDYLQRSAAKYGQSPYAKQTHILKAANNIIHNTRRYQPVARKLSMGTRLTTRRSKKTRKSTSAYGSGSYLDPFAHK
jgi:hypothetical protein